MLCIVCVYTVPVPCVNHSGIIFTCVLSGGTVHVCALPVCTHAAALPVLKSQESRRRPDHPCAASNWTPQLGDNAVETIENFVSWVVCNDNYLSRYMWAHVVPMNTQNTMPGKIDHLRTWHSSATSSSSRVYMHTSAHASLHALNLCLTNMLCHKIQLILSFLLNSSSIQHFRMTCMQFQIRLPLKR